MTAAITAAFAKSKGKEGARMFIHPSGQGGEFAVGGELGEPRAIEIFASGVRAPVQVLHVYFWGAVEAGAPADSTFTTAGGAVTGSANALRTFAVGSAFHGVGAVPIQALAARPEGRGALGVLRAGVVLDIAQRAAREREEEEERSNVGRGHG